MDEKARQVLAKYEARIVQEQALQATLTREESMARIDDFLLPVGADTGALMSMVVKGMKAPTVLEVGASHGYSTLWLADAAKAAGGKVISLELSERKVAYAEKALADAGLRDHVEFMVGDALESIAKLPGPFDFVLIDLWKELYVPVFDAIYPKLAAGAAICADNIVDPPFFREHASAYRAHVRGLRGIESALLPIGAGIEFSRFSVGF